MARKPRIFTDTGKYHIILRGNNQQNLFYDNQDRIFMLNRLKKYSTELKIEIYAYCLMNNHIHILLGNATPTLSLFVQKLANSYVYYYNSKYERTGHLFQGRFKSEPINDDIYFKTVLRYILQNPEKAGISTTTAYKWSSFTALQKTEQQNWINTQYLIELFNSKEQLLKFINEQDNLKYMEYNNKLRISDIKAITLIKKIFRQHPSQLIKINPEISLPKIKILKQKGLSITQITRLTGLSRKVVSCA